ncbi:MAG: hypothetical protein QM811_14275 [Pirellulales bacterium]
MSPKPPLNPFHLLLGIAGIAFTLTAVGYTMVILRAEKQTWIAEGHERAVTPNERSLPPAEHPFLKLLRNEGSTILIIEIAVVAVLACAAIGLDRFRDIRAAKRGGKRAIDASASPDKAAAPDA